MEVFGGLTYLYFVSVQSTHTLYLDRANCRLRLFCIFCRRDNRRWSRPLEPIMRRPAPPAPKFPRNIVGAVNLPPILPDLKYRIFFFMYSYIYRYKTQSFQDKRKFLRVKLRRWEIDFFISSFFLKAACKKFLPELLCSSSCIILMISPFWPSCLEMIEFWENLFWFAEIAPTPTASLFKLLPGGQDAWIPVDTLWRNLVASVAALPTRARHLPSCLSQAQ